MAFRDVCSPTPRDMDMVGYLTTVETLMDLSPNVFKKIFVNPCDEHNIPPDVSREAREIYETNYGTDPPWNTILEWWKENSAEHYPRLTGSGPPIDPLATTRKRCFGVDNNDQEEAGGSSICNKEHFDPTTKTYQKVVVYPGKGKRRKEEFSLSDFLARKLLRSEAIRLIFDDDDEFEGDYHWDDDPRERSRRHASADRALQKMAQLVSVLNNACNYEVLSVQSVRYVD